MTRVIEISNSDDIIDVLDVIERIEALETELEAEKGLFAQHPAAPDTPARQYRAANVLRIAEQLEPLDTLMGELRGKGGDEYWRGNWYPLTLIRDSHFVQAMQELCEDIGDFPNGVPHYYVIDWEATARNLRMDYSPVEFDGVTYWYS